MLDQPTDLPGPVEECILKVRGKDVLYVGMGDLPEMSSYYVVPGAIEKFKYCKVNGLDVSSVTPIKDTTVKKMITTKIQKKHGNFKKVDFW